MRRTAAAQPIPAQPVRRPSNLTRDTRTGEVYWCDFNPTNLTPEFDAQHLVVIVRGGKISHDVAVVVPLTKSDQSRNPHGHRVLHNPNPGSAEVSWAVCDHIYTVASERLQPLRDGAGNRKVPQKLHHDDLVAISRKVRRAMNTFLTLGVTP